MDLRKLFHAPEADTEMEYGSSELEKSVRSEYQQQIQEQLARFGVPPDVAVVEMRHAGIFEGLPVMLAMVRLIAWQRKPAMRLLLGLPLLELNVRRTLQSTWLVDVSHFGGLWLHPSSQLERSNAAAEIRTLIAGFESEGSEAQETLPHLDEEQAWPHWPAGVTDLSPLGNDSKR